MMMAGMHCWEIRGCGNRDCAVFGRADVVCWLVPHGSCGSPAGEVAPDMEDCLSCPVFEAKMDLPLMKQTIRSLQGTMGRREQEVHELNLDLATSFSEIYDMLRRLGDGDPAARVKLHSSNELLCKLGDLLNTVAESLEQMVGESHEMAIGLCEHYDTLNKLAEGNFTARAAEDSRNELVAKLGALINREALTLVGTIDNLREAEDQLLAAYQKLQDIIDFLPDGTFVIDGEGKIIAWNRAIEEITGKSKGEMIGAGGYSYAVPFYGEPRPVLIDFINQEQISTPGNYLYIDRKGATLNSEVHIPSFQGGEEKYFWATASSLFDREGRKVGAIESIRDITHNKKAEEETKRLEAQLRQSQKMEAIGRLAGGIAHDFNNLLTAIIGYTSLLQLSAQGNQKVLHYVDQIDQVVRKAAKLTKDILTFSRKQVMNPSAVDLLGLIRGMEEMLHRIIGEDIHFCVEYCTEPLTVQVDPGQLQQVILNLVTNARDAMPRGGKLRITAELASPSDNLPHGEGFNGGHYALLTVSDNGSGMDAVTRERIFEPFYTTKEVGKGTGLGLSIAFGIISQHNGIIQVKSAPDAGTTFLIYLPIDESGGQTGKYEHQRCPAGTRRGNETILLAEDNQEARDVFRATLERAGYTVLAAVDGEDAIARFREHSGRVDLVILDVIMPRKNGKQVLEELKKVRPDIKSIFTSGYTAEIIHRKGQFAVGANFISKPALPGELLVKVRDVLDRNSFEGTGEAA